MSDDLIYEPIPPAPADRPNTLQQKFVELQGQFRHAMNIVYGLKNEVAVKDAQIELLLASQCSCTGEGCCGMGGGCNEH